MVLEFDSVRVFDICFDIQKSAQLRLYTISNKVFEIFLNNNNNNKLIPVIAMKTIILAACAAFGIFSVVSIQATENEKTIFHTVKNIEKSNLRGVKASAGFDVTIKQGATSDAVISVSSELEPYLRVEVKDGILVLGFDNIPNELQNKLWRKNAVRKAEVVVTSLEKLSASSGAQIKNEGGIVASEDCEIRASSGARINVADMTAQEISVDVSSGASIAITGTADELDADASSGSSANLSGLKAKTVNASASSGASIKCFTTESLDARASSGGSIRYAAPNSLSNSSISISFGGSCKKVSF